MRSARWPARRATTRPASCASFTPANFVTGTGLLGGRKVVVGGDDFTVRGGAADASIAGKQIFAEQLANELRLPIVRLVEGTGGGGSVKTLETSGHTYVPVNPGWNYVVDNLSTVPVVAAGLGPVAGLGAARLCAAHLSILVEGTAQLFVAGPPVVRSGVGEDVDKEQLGGSRVHARNGGGRPHRRLRGRGFPADQDVPVLPAAQCLRTAAGDRRRRPGRAAGAGVAGCHSAGPAPAVPDPADPGRGLRRGFGPGGSASTAARSSPPWPGWTATRSGWSPATRTCPAAA